MDRLVTDNLMNRLKDSVSRQIFGKMFDVGAEENFVRGRTGGNINRSPTASHSLPLDNDLKSQLLLD